MNEYMMINYGTGTTEDWDAFFTMLHQKDHFVEGSSLKHLWTASDGTFSESNTEAATGYITIKASDLEEAKGVVLQSPVYRNGGTVQLLEFN